RRLASEAFEKMRMAALQDGIRLYSVSSYRSFHSQKRIWNRKYRQYQKKGMNHQAIVETIIQYSSIPGTSRHHWGTDLDIIDESLPRPSDPLLPEHFLEGGIYHPLYLWLQKHAADYGFYEAYTNDAKRSGYAYEPWHWSFAFLSIPFLQQYQQIDLYRHLRQSDMEGHAKFTREFAERFKREWVGGVNPKLIPK
ncbi:MAG: M15 family metallopeptidase, partial [Candidatus Hinthialibacter sp.]